MKPTSRIITKVLQGLGFFAVLLSLHLVGGAVAAAIFNPNDILVGDASGKVIRVDPGTGVQTIIYAAGNPYGMAIAQNGDLFVADDLGAQVIRINVTTGVPTVVSSGGSFANPQGVAVAANGDLLVIDGRAFGTGAVFHVDPTTGIQTVVSQGGYFVNPYGIALEADGDILVVDPSAFPGSCPAPGCGGVIRVNPMTGTQTIVSSGGLFIDPAVAAVHPNGDIFVVDGGGGTGGGVIRVDPTTGGQTWISNHGLFRGPQAIALEADGNGRNQSSAPLGQATRRSRVVWGLTGQLA